MSYPVPSRGVIHFQKCRRFAGEGTKLQNSYILDNKIVKKKMEIERFRQCARADADTDVWNSPKGHALAPQFKHRAPGSRMDEDM